MMESEQKSESGTLMVGVSVVFGILSFFVFAFVFGGIAILCGFVAVAQGAKGGWIGVFIGLMAILLYVILLGQIY